MRRGFKPALWGIAAAAFVFALGAWGGAIAPGERGGFTMNYPATGKDVGGPSPRELTGRIVVTLDDAGLIKRLTQPNVVEVSSHVVRNTGPVPRRIRFEADGLGGTPVEWHSRDRAWNPGTHAIDRVIAPGESVDVGLLVTLPRPIPTDAVLLKAAIVVVDAETDKRLSVLPVTIAHNGASVAGGSCCE